MPSNTARSPVDGHANLASSPPSFTVRSHACREREAHYPSCGTGTRPSIGLATSMRIPRVLVIFALSAMVSACGILGGPPPSGRILVTTESGAPIAGAKLVPDEDPQPGQTRPYDDSPKTNAQGMVTVYLEDFYWDTDSCYHFRVRRAGYDDVTMAVSKDLMPALLKIKMTAQSPAPAAARP